MLQIGQNHGNEVLRGMVGGSLCPVTGTWWCWKAKVLFFLTYQMFCSPNVTWYFVIPWSFLAIHHPELQVKAGTQFKKLSLLACLRVLLNPWRAMSMGYTRAGSVTLDGVCPRWSVVPRPRGGKGSRLSCWDLLASWAGWPRAGSVPGAGLGVPPLPVSLGKAEIQKVA